MPKWANRLHVQDKFGISIARGGTSGSRHGQFVWYCCAYDTKTETRKNRSSTFINSSTAAAQFVLNMSQVQQKPKSFGRLYTMYYFHFPFVMLTTTETMLLHTFVLMFALLVAYGIYAYLPSSIMFAISRAYYYVLAWILVPSTVMQSSAVYLVL